MKSGANEIEGCISLGVIPPALPVTAQLTGFIARQCPKIDFSVTGLLQSAVPHDSPAERAVLRIGVQVP